MRGHKRASARTVVIFGSALALIGALPSAAGAATSSGGAGASAGPILTDRDFNGISDGLQARLDAARQGDRFDVAVTFDGPGDAASAQRAVGAFTVRREFRIVRGFAAQMTAAQARALARRAEVFRVEEEFVVSVTNDSANRDFGTEAARAEHGVDGTGVEICVIDTGIDRTHEQFVPASGVWSDKIVGWHDYVGTGSEPYDDHGHGTHVSGTAAGDGVGGPDAATFKGVAPAALIRSMKVLDGWGFGDDPDVVQAVQDCAETPSVDVISMSLGSGGSSDGTDLLSQAVNNAASSPYNKVVVVAAGNSGDEKRTIGSPGAAANAITVGAAGEHSAPALSDRRTEGINLAFFSSRGPTADGRVKPDVVAPGVSIRSAQANSNGYVTFSGTSMATPFTAGTVALMLDASPDANPPLTPAQVKSMVEGTADDWGPAGKDVDWGAGLLDGRGAVGQAAGVAATNTAFPTHTRIEGSVPNGGRRVYEFWLNPEGLWTPISATMIIEGQAVCFYGCLVVEFSPDLDVEIKDPDGAQIALSQCALGDECGIGRQETAHAMPTKAGRYTIEVYPYAGDPNNGKGGSFGIDLSTGSLAAGPPPPPPMHVGDLDGTSLAVKGGWKARVTVTAHTEGEATLSGATVSFTWSGGSSGSGSCVTGATGTCSVTTGKIPNKTSASVTFTVSGMGHSSYTYASGTNHNGAGDTDSTNGTQITVTR